MSNIVHIYGRMGTIDSLVDTTITTSTGPLFLLEQIMAHAPSVTTFIRKEFRTGHVEDLPAVEPHGSVFGSICFLEMRPDLVLAGVHLAQPVLELS
jgi:hypothetical protein